jgi:hypothetical protein
MLDGEPVPALHFDGRHAALGQRLEPRAHEPLGAGARFSPTDAERTGPHKYILGEAYSGTQGSKMEAKVRQLDTLVSYMLRRWNDRSPESGAEDVTQLVGAGVLVFCAGTKPRRQVLDGAAALVARVVAGADCPSLRRLAHAGRLVVMVLEQAQCPLTTSQRAVAERLDRTSEQLAAVCRTEALSEEDVPAQAQLPLRIAHHCREHFLHRAEQRFLSRKHQLDLVVYSLIRVESGALAQELYLRIAEGEADFAELAAHYTKGPEQTTRGVVGPVPILQAHPVLAELLRTSRPGQLSPPLLIEQWWLVVRLEVMRPATFDDAMQERMGRELFEEWVEEQVSELVKMREKA